MIRLSWQYPLNATWAHNLPSDLIGGLVTCVTETEADHGEKRSYEVNPKRVRLFQLFYLM